MLEWLKAILGEGVYTDDIDKKVSEQIGKDFVARPDFNAANEAKKTAENEIKARDKQIDELKKVDPEALQATITSLQTQNADAQKQYDAQLKQIKQDSLLETRLIKEGAINTKAVKALLDPTKISMDGENLVGLDDQLKGLKETEKWAFTAAAAGRSGGRQGTPAAGEENTLADEIAGSVFGTQR
jgi:hypothetical protein